MVNANVENLSEAFDSIIEDRDVVGAATLGVAGAGGGVIATQLAGRIAPIVGLEQQPTELTGLVANGLVKMLVGAGLGFLAIRLGGMPGAILAVAALGALVLGGGDWINGLLSSSAGVPGAAPSGNSRARVVSASSNGNMMDDDMEMRAADTGRGGSPERDTRFR